MYTKFEEIKDYYTSLAFLHELNENNKIQIYNHDTHFEITLINKSLEHYICLSQDLITTIHIKIKFSNSFYTKWYNNQGLTSQQIIFNLQQLRRKKYKQLIIDNVKYYLTESDKNCFTFSFLPIKVKNLNHLKYILIDKNELERFIIYEWKLSSK